MTAYFAMLAVPAFAAMAGMGRARITLLIVAVLYWLMVGFRFKVGMDWTNYIQLYEYRFVLGAGSSLLAAITSIEPGFALLSWIAAKTGGDIYFINAVSALIFCWGFFAFARRCPEPFLAVVAATPLVVIAMAMNLTRQSAAVGIIAFLFATWERRGTVARMAFVLVAATFHFSALFVMVFVALAAKTTAFARYAAAALILAMIVVITMLAPGAWEAYSRLYISGRGPSSISPCSHSAACFICCSNPGGLPRKKNACSTVTSRSPRLRRSGWRSSRPWPPTGSASISGQLRCMPLAPSRQSSHGRKVASCPVS
jgi:hypothetical protein